MIPLTAEAELVAIMAKRAYDELVEQEDQEMKDNYGPGMLGATAANYGRECKAFDRVGYRKEVAGMTKAKMLETLMKEAELRYNHQCDLWRAQQELDEAQRELERLKINSDSTIHHWKTAAMRLSDAVQSLVTM